MAGVSTSTSIEEELNRLRSVLRSDDHLQIQNCGDFDLVRLKLDHDVQISFLFDSLNTLTETLSTKNTHDLRISKTSQKCSLTAEQWTEIRKYFDEVQRYPANDDPSIYSLLQLIQDRLLQMSVKAGKGKGKRSTNATANADQPVNNNNVRFRGADLIFNRLLHDPTIDRGQVIIGYEDRFTGIHEIAFNEFKKVHEHEYGVPMHRIRHYKINGRLVWDRTNKIDVLTGSEQQIELLENQTFFQGLYQFDRTSYQWVLCPEVPLTADDPKTPSTPDMCLPEHCHILTWNILFDYHHSSSIFTSSRYPRILDQLKTLLPDIICLQEVTRPFLNLLLNESWLAENNYYFILKKSVIDSIQNQSYGQMMLMKNIRPRSWQILPLEETTKKTTKEYIHARFGINARVTIDLLNVHLHSNRSKNPEEKRCQALERFFTQMETKNFMIIGDVNFGDYDTKEQTFLKQYEGEIHDLWKEMYSLDENPGFTFEPSTNICAKITSDTQINRRFDRYFLHPLHNLCYSIEHLSMIGKERFSVDENQREMHPSDHYALQLMINFRIRSISHRSALVMLPNREHWPSIESIREENDPSFNRWPPHINFLWPFFDVNDNESDAEKILLPLRMILSEHESFQVNFDRIETFEENQITFIKLNSSSEEQMKKLFNELKQNFPQCCVNQRNAYNPHLTIGQGKKLESIPSFSPFSSFVNHLYILQRSHDDDNEPFRLTYQIPLGSILEPISSRQYPLIDEKLKRFFDEHQIYADDQTYRNKSDKFQRLSVCFRTIFNSKTLHRFTHSFVPYGSFRLGIRGQDLDTTFVLREKLHSNENETDFDRSLRLLKSDRSALTKHVAEILESQIKSSFVDEIVRFKLIEANFSLISIQFHDETKVEIFIDVQTEDHSSIHGLHDIERLLIYARSPILFQYLLSFIRHWAQKTGLYGQVFGYLGGYAWAILCANICHESLSKISSVENFKFDEFFSLVHSFFSTYSQFIWSSQTFHLYPNQARRLPPIDSTSVFHQGSMRILCLAPSDHNAARATTKSTRDLIHQTLKHAYQMLNNSNTLTVDDQYEVLNRILRMNSSFPHSKIQSIIQLTITAETPADLLDWIGWIQSRLIRLFLVCENECHFTIQPNNNYECSTSNPLEKIYSIGVEMTEEQLRNDRRFSHHFQRFIDRCQSYSDRKESMKIESNLIDVNDWKLRRMQPKPQRVQRN